jgi:ABC-type bacteriocin/lantibiotic exporter with double-glycine peptidase domain
MDEISYNIPLLTQNIQDCVQASASQILSHYGITKSIDEVKKEVPVYISSDGKPLGSSLGHIATYFIQLGFTTTLHTVDIEIFDPSWKNLDNSAVIQKLKERRKYLRHARYEEAALDLVVSGYVLFLEKGGKITFPIVDEAYLYTLLQKGPIYTILSYNFLNQVSKYAFNSDVKPIQDSIMGIPTTHAVVISGYKQGKFEITDPDYEFGGKKLLEAGQVIGAFYLAETDFDPLLITLER